MSNMRRGDPTEAQRDELFRGARPSRGQADNKPQQSVTSNDELLQVGRELHGETTDALRRGLQIVNQTNEIQDQTLNVLHDQTKQMQRIDHDLEKMKHDVRYSEKILTYMSRCCCLQCCFTDPEVAKQKDWQKNVQQLHLAETNPYAAPQTAGATRANGKQQAAAAIADKYGGSRPMAVNTDGLANYGFGEHAQAIDAETRKQDDILNDISDGLDKLARKAMVMQDALNQQDKPMEDLVGKAEHMNVRVQGMNNDSILRQYKPRK